jgi:hypothetical protein
LANNEFRAEVKLRQRLVRLAATVAGLAAIAVTCAAISRSDEVAYLVNVTVRPGYAFSNREAALTYGHGICDGVAKENTYGQLMRSVKADFSDPDEFQASYLISQAVNELCPESIWQLRNSAAGYRPEAP